MALPQRVFFTLHETAARWGCTVSDIAGWATTEKLQIMTGIEPVQCGETLVAGQVVLSPMDLLSMFRRCGTGPIERKVRRVLPPGGSEWQHITDPTDGVTEALRAVMSGVVEAATAPLESVAALREAVAASGAEAGTALTGAISAAEGLEDALDSTGEAAGRAGGAGRGAGQALREAADTARGAWEATADAVRAAQERSREIAQVLAQDIVGPIKEALKSGEFTWETFASAISRIAQNLANRLIELAFKPIENAIMRAFSGMGGGGGFLASLFGFARGGVFAGGQELTAFARGGVVNRPTVFPFSRGIGLMGEAGPEAILPLRRGRDGRLGVEMNSTPAQPAQDMSTRIINVLDPSVVGDYLATPSGERAILNVIRRNRSALNA